MSQEGKDKKVIKNRLVAAKKGFIALKSAFWLFLLAVGIIFAVQIFWLDDVLEQIISLALGTGIISASSSKLEKIVEQLREV